MNDFRIRSIFWYYSYLHNFTDFTSSLSYIPCQFIVNQLIGSKISKLIEFVSLKMAFFTNRRNSIIQTRIKLLTGKNNLSTNSSTESDDSLKLSPILQELNGKKDRVKRFSDLFERQPWLSKFGCPNWWLEEGMLKTPVVNNDSTTNLTLEFNYKCKISSTPISKMKSARRTSLDDLISLERKYIKEIENHTNDLKKKLKSGVGFDPMRIREFDVSVYGNIMELLSLHSTLILPKMLSIERKNGKCLEVFDFLLRMLNENGFYCYVNYKMLEQVTNKCKSQLSHSDYVTFDAFGIFNRYNDCIKAKFDDTEEDERDREKNLCETFGKVTTAFMGLIFEAKQVTHIQQIEKVSLDALFKLYKIRQRKCPEMKGAIIPLIPSRHVKFGYRSPVS